MKKLLEVCSAIGFMGVGGSLYAILRGEANTTLGGGVVCATMCVLLLTEIGGNLAKSLPKDGEPPTAT